MIGGGEILVVLGAILFMFGGTKFSDWVKRIKKAKKDFKDAINENEDVKKYKNAEKDFKEAINGDEDVKQYNEAKKEVRDTLK